MRDQEIKMRTGLRFVCGIYFALGLLASPLLVAEEKPQAVTLAGTPIEGEVNPFTLLFAGDVFSNFRNMEDFVP